LKGVGRAYGNSFFKVINVMNKRKCQKKMYSIVSHHNLNESIITTCIAKLQNIDMKICFMMILAYNLIHPLKNSYPPSAKGKSQLYTSQANFKNRMSLKYLQAG
jgi:hypothetical protein